ncbi:hypothetical protein MPH_13059 [Macrophomina phaseolina MS6]|uniref:Uncharacterized protein n=1 Tax=Macrophomina phaseolina (strain MS6) TaxID=1126212 RepID=K2RAE1_MACPH|nr:hypothetical protein MPH_13059 [Macrophomina phaseolina MS6]
MDPRRQYPQAQPPHQQLAQPYYNNYQRPLPPQQQQQQQHHHHPHHLQPQQQQPSNPRFSWQIPLSEADQLPIHQLDPTPSSPPPHQQPQDPAQAQAQAQAQSPPQVNRFSYAQTPIEVQQPHFHQNATSRLRNESNMPHSPQSVHPSNLNSPMTEFGDVSAISTTAPQLPVPPMSRPLSKEIGEDMGGQGGMVPEEYARPMPQEPHPAFFAPVVDTSPRGSIAQPRQRQQSIAQSVAQSDHSNHRPQQPQNYDAHPPPASPGPIPIKTENDDTKAAHDAPLSPISPTQPYSPHSNVPSSRPPIFAPDNPSGPNGMLTAEHRPGQIAHPNMDLNSSGSKHEWKHSLCECSGDVGTCMTGVFCPCVLYGKTSYRLGLKSEKKDPTEMLGWSWANGKCGLMAMTTLCGLCGMFYLSIRVLCAQQSPP